jgi:hypothetical protein
VFISFFFFFSFFILPARAVVANMTKREDEKLDVVGLAPILDHGYSGMQP